MYRDYILITYTWHYLIAKKHSKAKNFDLTIKFNVHVKWLEISNLVVFQAVSLHVWISA